MATLYCPECGYKNEYSIHPPTFCGGCGENISAGKSPEPKKSIKKRTNKAKARLDSDDETDIDYVPEIGQRLEVDISYEMEGRRSMRGEDLEVRPNPPKDSPE